MQLHTISTYTQDRYTFLRAEEGLPTDQTAGPNFGHAYAYADSAGIPTIGIGIDIQAEPPLK